MISIRSISSLVPALIISFAALACNSDTSVVAADTAADDQALMLSVMSARGDTLPASIEEERAEPNSADVIIQQSPQKRIRPAPLSVPVTSVATTKSPAPRQQPAASPPAPVSIARVADKPATAREPLAADDDRAGPAPKRAPRAARTAIIASGSPLAVFTSQKACGRTFRAVVLRAVRGTNGVVIPAGAQASGEVTSVDKWGAGIGVRITSVHFDGNSYPVSSRTSYVLPESQGCIPAHARIDVETKESLRIEAVS